MAALERRACDRRQKTRRNTDRERHWLLDFHRNFYRDIWLLLISGVVVLALVVAVQGSNDAASNQASDTKALCAFRHELEDRAFNAQQFLQAHPHGIPGISNSEIRQGILNEQATLAALKPLQCKD